MDGMKRKMWDEVAAAVGGTVVGEADVWKNSTRVEAPIEGGPWTATLDVYTTVVMVGKVPVPVYFSRVVAPFLPLGDFRLTIYRANPFSEVAKLFGMQDIGVEDATFNRTFIIKGNDSERVRRLFNGEAGEKLREGLLQIPHLHFGISDSGHEAGIDGRKQGIPGAANTDFVYAIKSGVESETLIASYQLVAETLRGLHRVGAASAEV